MLGQHIATVVLLSTLNMLSYITVVIETFKCLYHLSHMQHELAL